MKLLIIGLISFLVNFFTRKGTSAFLLFFGAFLVMGFQGKAGWDYLDYEKSFFKIREGTYNGYTESGWYLLNEYFPYSSFPVLVCFISFVQYLILALVVDKYVPGKIWRNFSFFLFFFTQSFLGFQLTGLRQGLATELLLLIYLLIDDRKYCLALFFTWIMYNIHNSSLLCAPFILLFILIKFIAKSKNELNIKNKIQVIVPFLFVFYNKNLIIDFFETTLSKYVLTQYAGYMRQFDFFDVSPLIILFDFICIVAICFYLREAKGGLKYFAYMSIVGLFGETLLFGLGDLPRLSYYFSIFHIIVLPNVAIYLYKTWGKISSCLFVLLCCAYSLKTFLPYVTNPEIPRILNFKFIFEL